MKGGVPDSLYTTDPPLPLSAIFPTSIHPANFGFNNLIGIIAGPLDGFNDAVLPLVFLHDYTLVSTLVIFGTATSQAFP